MTSTSVSESIQQGRIALQKAGSAIPEGYLVRVIGSVLEAKGLAISIGSRVCIADTEGEKYVEAECVGFKEDSIFLMPFDPVVGLAPKMRVFPAGMPLRDARGYRNPSQGMAALPIGSELFGRVVDGLGRPLDGLGGARFQTSDLETRRVNLMDRGTIRDQIDTGIRAIDGFLTVGRGQRIGIFSSSGMGKSTLISLLGKNCVADAIVIGLVGERSREVKEFCADYLNDDATKRSVIVAATSDTLPLARLKSAEYAMKVAAWFRDSGRHTILILDSLTRYAMAQRDLGLALGEAPVSRGFPPSVFEKIPVLVEQSGNLQSGTGSLTSFYTVLLESEEFSDPVAEAVRGCLDGHIFLSSKLVGRGHFPAIDIEKSISRIMPRIVTGAHLQAVHKLKTLLAKYHETQEMRSMGVYSPGVDADADLSLKIWPMLNKFLQQDLAESSRFDQTVEFLFKIAGEKNV